MLATNEQIVVTLPSVRHSFTTPVTLESSFDRKEPRSKISEGDVHSRLVVFIALYLPKCNQTVTTRSSQVPNAVMALRFPTTARRAGAAGRAGRYLGTHSVVVINWKLLGKMGAVAAVGRSVGPLQIHLERNLLYVVLYGSTRAAQRRSRSKPAAQDVNIPMTDVRPRCRRRMRLRGDYCTEMAKKECKFC